MRDLQHGGRAVRTTAAGEAILGGIKDPRARREAVAYMMLVGSCGEVRAVAGRGVYCGCSHACRRFRLFSARIGGAASDWVGAGAPADMAGKLRGCCVGKAVVWTFGLLSAVSFVY